MNTLKLELLRDGKPIDVDFRLQYKSLVALESKHKEDRQTIIMTAASELDVMLDVLNEALNFKDNKNLITDAEEVYDLLVDNGYAGMDGFAELLVKIGNVSGIFKEKQAGRLLAVVEKQVESIFEGLEDNLVEGLTETETPSEAEKAEQGD